MAIPQPRTHQYESFSTNLTYARKMVAAGEALAVLRPSGIDTRDFYRAAWVQAISALEHWVQEEVLRRVAEQADKGSPDMPRKLREFRLPLESVESVQRGDLTLAQAVVDHVRADVAYRSLQNPDAIAQAMGLVTDVKVWREAAKHINRWNHHRTSMDMKQLRGRYVELLQRRNQIAHDADLIAGEHTERHDINAAQASDAIDWIERIALALAYALDSDSAATSDAVIPQARGAVS
jgi:restriction system protein